MEEKKILTDEELDNVVGGTRSDEIVVDRDFQLVAIFPHIVWYEASRDC